ncbi:efflux RND transporter periplasmic adaptor subunit [Candidatus Shapirobacteria bacterium]|nr:efflux RND transporter periplasmic adaptor subunit [Candidatus Shapirobacteria bacterium]
MNKVNKIIKSIRHQFARHPLMMAVLILIIAGGTYWFFSQKPKNGIRTALVTKQNLTETISASGEIKAENQAELVFTAPGKVAWLGVKEGDMVKRGQALASMDKFLLNVAYQQAAANLRKFEASLDNIHDQVKNHDTDEDFATKDKRTNAETNKDFYYEAVRAAEYNLKNSTLISPISGTVTTVSGISPGENLTATSLGSNVIKVVDFNTLVFEASVDEVDFRKITLGQKVDVLLDAFSDKKISGEVIYISREGKKTITGGTVIPVKIKLTSDQEKLAVGLGGEAEFVVNQKDNVLTVPREFIKNDGRNNYVTIRQDNNSFIEVPVQVGLTTITDSEIIGDIKEGQEVILQNYGKK